MNNFRTMPDPRLYVGQDANKRFYKDMTSYLAKCEEIEKANKEYQDKLKHGFEVYTRQMKRSQLDEDDHREELRCKAYDQGGASYVDPSESTF